MASSRGWLRHRADRRTLGFAATFFGAVAAVWRLASVAPVLALVLWPVLPVMAFVGAVSTHNVIHSPMFTRPWMNAAWRIVQTLWYGQPVSLFVPVHNHSHHKHVQSRRDLTRTTKVDHRWQLVNLIAGVQWQRAAARDVKLYLAAQDAQQGKLTRQFRVELAALVLVYVALAVWSWPRWLAFVVVPHLCGAFGIRAINFLQHDGCDYDADGYDHSRNFTGRWFNWLFLNNGYHTVHHMRPGLHWSVLPDKHAAMVAPHMHPALDVQSFGPWFWRAILWPGRRERFDGTPYQWPPEGEGPDLPWDFRVAPAYVVEFGGESAEEPASIQRSA